ncbi:unnamed protein product [Gongylonema pulchrum]|uniref:CXXC-type zinc finger protein 1 n=1 Tax=Gongylonema pulchrum TaxID=637853 RepID=A0A183EZF5_9BILA|nr:unnamed protein product [Gongylonema pulchrum]
MLEKHESRTSEHDEHTDTDYMLHCSVCALQFPTKYIIKHIERCFFRAERQSCFGTANKSRVNPYNIFCEEYNKSNNTFCKRLRVLCSEHSKPVDGNRKVS